MSVKKIGKAKIDLKDEAWTVPGLTGKFLNNRRLVDMRPEVKTLRSQYAKIVRSKSPLSKRERKQKFDADLKKMLTQIYEEIRQDSFQFPIPLQKAHDYDHQGDWRYSLFRGTIYQFDRPGYHDDELLQQIRQLEGEKPQETSE